MDQDVGQMAPRWAKKAEKEEKMRMRCVKMVKNTRLAKKCQQTMIFARFEGPIWAPDGPRWPPHGPRRSPDRPRRPPRWPQDGELYFSKMLYPDLNQKMAPDELKMAPRRPNMAPIWPQDGPRRTQDGPGWAKMSTRWPQDGPRKRIKRRR